MEIKTLYDVEDTVFFIEKNIIEQGFVKSIYITVQPNGGANVPMIKYLIKPIGADYNIQKLQAQVGLTKEELFAKL